MTRKISTILHAALVATVLGFGLWGCSDDFGTPCTFPASPDINQFCGASGPLSTSTSTCIDPINADCETRLCVRFQGSDSFCSQRCSSGGGCPSSSTCEFPLGSDLGVCVPTRFSAP